MLEEEHERLREQQSRRANTPTAPKPSFAEPGDEPLSVEARNYEWCELMVQNTCIPVPDVKGVPPNTLVLLPSAGDSRTPGELAVRRITAIGETTFTAVRLTMGSKHIAEPKRNHRYDLQGTGWIVSKSILLKGIQALRDAASAAMPAGEPPFLPTVEPPMPQASTLGFDIDVTMNMEAQQATGPLGPQVIPPIRVPRVVAPRVVPPPSMSGGLNMHEPQPMADGILPMAFVLKLFALTQCLFFTF